MEKLCQILFSFYIRSKFYNKFNEWSKIQSKPIICLSPFQQKKGYTTRHGALLCAPSARQIWFAFPFLANQPAGSRMKAKMRHFGWVTFGFMKNRKKSEKENGNYYVSFCSRTWRMANVGQFCFTLALFEKFANSAGWSESEWRERKRGTTGSRLCVCFKLLLFLRWTFY